LILALAAAAPTLRAATDDAVFTVSATVISACAISATDLDFGNYDPVAGTDVDATSSIDIACTLGSPYSVALNAGTTPGATVATRLLTDGTDTLTYNLYSDASRTTVWGETIGTNVVTGNGSGATQTLTVYGRLDGGQNVPAATFSDTVTATVTF
jgi:spore coat protein U-like protein